MWMTSINKDARASTAWPYETHSGNFGAAGRFLMLIVWSWVRFERSKDSCTSWAHDKRTDDSRHPTLSRKCLDPSVRRDQSNENPTDRSLGQKSTRCSKSQGHWKKGVIPVDPTPDWCLWSQIKERKDCPWAFKISGTSTLIICVPSKRTCKVVSGGIDRRNVSSADMKLSSILSCLKINVRSRRGFDELSLACSGPTNRGNASAKPIQDSSASASRLSKLMRRLSFGGMKGCWTSFLKSSPHRIKDSRDSVAFDGLWSGNNLFNESSKPPVKTEASESRSSERLKAYSWANLCSFPIRSWRKVLRFRSTKQTVQVKCLGPWRVSILRTTSLSNVTDE